MSQPPLDAGVMPPPSRFPLPALAALVQNEVRVRTRRISTLVCIALVVLLTWSVVADPSTGRAMIVIGKKMVAYNSLALALGTSGMATFIFGLLGFYLVRGRTREDLQYGLGAVLGATPISNATFIFSRWLGAMVYLLVLLIAIALTMMVLQAVRGFDRVEPLTILGTYFLFLLPTFSLAASVAVLCDAHPKLMGKGGDVLYLGLWMGQFGVLPGEIMRRTPDLSFASFLDVSGLATLIVRLRQMLGESSGFSIGGSSYDSRLAPIVLDHFWTMELVGARLACALLAMVPLVLAIMVFHRYAPDRVKPMARARKVGVWVWVNRALQPVTATIAPLYRLALALPGWAGQLVAQIALTLSSNPLLFVMAIGAWIAGMLVPSDDLRAVLVIGLGVWGVTVSDLSARDYQAGTASMTGTAVGGAARRTVMQFGVAALLGVLLTSPVWVRLLADGAGVSVIALMVGLLAISAALIVVGQLTKGGRTFLAVFLFWLYVAYKVPIFRWLDVVGFNRLADTETIATFGLVGCGLLVMGAVYADWQRR